MSKLYLFVASLLLATSAQAINKCVGATGLVSYQESPCPKDTKSGVLDLSQIKAGKVPEGEELERRKFQCAEMIRNGVVWKDPDSVKLGNVIRVGSGQSLKPGVGTIIRYGADVNAKNSYGAYTGKRVAFCEFDLAEKVIVNVHVSQD